MIMRFVKNNIFLFLVILCALPTLYGLAHNGFFVSDDGEWMIIRLSAFFETLKSGEIPVRYIARLNNGYGYPLANFMYPGFLYVGSVIHLLGFGFIATIKIIFGLSLILSGVFTYLWLQKIFPKIPAFFGVILYIYMPYHLFDLYVRGSIGELLALCVVPFVLWQMERKDVVLTAVGIGFLILSHNTLAFLFAVPLYGYLVLRSEGTITRKILSSALPFILGALLSFFFWLPALYDLQYTVFKSVTISEWEKYFAEFNLIGIATSVILTIGLYHIIIKRDKSLKNNSLFYFFMIMGIGAIFISLPISYVFWKLFPSSIIQFPFRALSLAIPAIAYIATFLLALQPKNKQIVLGVVLIAFAFMSTYPYMFPKEFTDKNDMYYITNFSTTTVKDEYMPIWVKQSLPPLGERKVEIIKGEGTLSDEIVVANKISFKTNMQSPGTIQVNAIYFPGWEAKVFEKPYALQYDNPYGLMQMKLPAGSHVVSLRFTETPIRLIADFVSVVTAIILLFIFFKKVRYNAIQLQ